MMRTPGALLPAALALALLQAPAFSAPGWSQGVTVEVAAGQATYEPLGSAIRSGDVSLGISSERGPFWGYLSAGTGVSDARSLWGAGGISGLIVSSGALEPGVALAAQAYSYSDTATTGSGATLSALPGIGAALGPLAARLQSGLVQHTDWYGDTTVTRRGHDTQVLFSAMRGTIAGSVQGRLLRISGGDYPYAGVTVEASHNSAVLWAEAGQWMADGFSTPRLGIGASVRLPNGVQLGGGWEQEPVDPLYFNPPQRGWSVRISRTFGGGNALAAWTEHAADGRTTIRIPQSHSAAAPSILGDFTAWQPVPMRPEGSFWSITLDIPPGTYYYGFNDGNGDWFIPPAFPQQVDDGMGGKTALLVVG